VLDTDVASAALRFVRELPLTILNVKDFTDFAEHEGLVMVP
jgi:hypothetical protein